MSSSIESLLAAVQRKELQNRRTSLAIFIFAVIASLVTIGILHSWYPWWCAFSALVLLGMFALYLIRAGGVRPCAVSPEEAAILIDAALPTKERFSALLSIGSSLDPIDTARSLFISQQLSEILAKGPHPAQIAPFKLSGSERCALITALLLTLSALLLFVFRPQPKLLALAAKIEGILAADPTVPEPLRAQALALAEAIKDTPLGSSQINMELNGARKELERALADSEKSKSLGERTVQGSKETREYPQEPKQKQATPIPVPPTPEPNEQKKQEPKEEKQEQGAQEQKEKEQSAKEQSGSGQGVEKEESGDNPSQQGSEQQEQAGEQKQQGGSEQGGSEQGESAADKDASAKEQGGQQGDGDGQGSGKGAGEGEEKGKGGEGKSGEGKGVGSGDGKGQGSGKSSDSDSSSANTGSAEASGATGKQDQWKQGSAGQQGAQGGSSASGSQSSSLQQLEAALNEVEQGVKQQEQGQGQGGKGAEKGAQQQSQPQPQPQSGSQAGAQGADFKGAGKGKGKGAAKEPSKSDLGKSENSDSDSKQDSNGERSSLPDRDAPAQTGGLSDGAGSAGLRSNQSFKEVPIGSLKEAIDERFTDESSNLEKNLEPAQAKTTIEDLPLAKPKGSLQRGEQPIPLEYSDILKGP